MVESLIRANKKNLIVQVLSYHLATKANLFSHVLKDNTSYLSLYSGLNKICKQNSIYIYYIYIFNNNIEVQLLLAKYENKLMVSLL